MVCSLVLNILLITLQYHTAVTDLMSIVIIRELHNQNLFLQILGNYIVTLIVVSFGQHRQLYLLRSKETYKKTSFLSKSVQEKMVRSSFSLLITH